MSCAVLLMTHPGLGQALLQTVHHLLGDPLPLPVGVMEPGWDEDPGTLLATLEARVRALDGGDGVLVLTDLYGATPSNLVARLQERMPEQVRRVAGVNLPMLLRVLNYPHLALDTLASTAADAARTGVLVDDA